MLHTVKIIALGFVILALCLIASRLIGGASQSMVLARAALVFIELTDGDGSAPVGTASVPAAFAGETPAIRTMAVTCLRKAGERELAPLAGALAALAGAIMPRLEALQQRVDDIAKTPLPPQAAARGLAGLSKREDGGAATASDDIVLALARMSEEERTLTLIKAAHANPIVR